MADVTEAIAQDQVAESLLGPEEQAEQPVEQTGTEQQDEAQPTEQLDAEEQPSDEIAEDWLPSDQDKVFTDDVLLRYAERYQKDQQWLSDPLNRQLLVDKLNTDIYLRQQQEQWQQEPQEEFEAEPEPTQPSQEQAPTREQWFQRLEQAVQQRTDPEVAKQFHSEFLRAFGVPEAEIAKAPPQQAMQFTQVASKYMLNLMSTFMGDMLQSQLMPQLNQAIPNFDNLVMRASRAEAWDNVRNSDARYESLPAYGTKEWKDLCTKLGRENPGLEQWGYSLVDPRTGKLHGEGAAKLYDMIAKIATGRAGNREALQRAAAAGAQGARRAAVRRSAGNLGSGQSKAGSASQSSRFQTNEDLFDDATMALYQREHGRL